jgi:hypothetical protein
MPDFFNTAAGTASIIGGIVTLGAVLHAWITSRSTRALQADIHTALQVSLTDMRKGFTESQERLGHILERMDARTERMNQLAEERHREVLQRLPEERPR